MLLYMIPFLLLAISLLEINRLMIKKLDIIQNLSSRSFIKVYSLFILTTFLLIIYKTNTKILSYAIAVEILTASIMFSLLFILFSIIHRAAFFKMTFINLLVMSLIFTPLILMLYSNGVISLENKLNYLLDNLITIFVYIFILTCSFCIGAKVPFTVRG